MMGTSTPERRNVKEKIIKFNSEKHKKAYVKSLTDYDIFSKDVDVEKLLLRFTDEARLNRGERIKNVTISIRKLTDEHVQAHVGKYRVEIDLNKRTILHDCDDWRKGIGIKRMCKHVVKLFLMLPIEKTRDILSSISKDKRDWSFRFKHNV
jgi:hypothetical protein